jgi:hypothetical protein
MAVQNLESVFGVVESARQGVTHEVFIHAIRRVVVAHLNDEEARRRLLTAKLVYGSGPRGVRGTCYYEAWDDGQRHEFIEVCALGEESDIQLAGTTIHELAHVLAGYKAGHGSAWKRAANTLGLSRAEAGGQRYQPLHFDPSVWQQINALMPPSDGRPSFERRGGRGIRPCPAGVGTRGGKSRGPGSGSRLLKVICPSCGYLVWSTWKWISKATPTCSICKVRMVEAPPLI